MSNQPNFDSLIDPPACKANERFCDGSDQRAFEMLNVVRVLTGEFSGMEGKIVGTKLNFSTGERRWAVRLGFDAESDCGSENVAFGESDLEFVRDC